MPDLEVAFDGEGILSAKMSGGHRVNYFTNLALSGDGVQPYATRGATQTLNPIAQASQLDRTVNGKLVDLSFDDGFQKYASTIACNDQTSPAFDKAWPGLQVTVDCISELSYKTLGGTPQRSVVPGSSRTDGDYTFYRPRLTMRIISYTAQTDEYGAVVSWSMQLEEV
jgi:hypothetical protein